MEKVGDVFDGGKNPPTVEDVLDVGLPAGPFCPPLLGGI